MQELHNELPELQESDLTSCQLTHNTCNHSQPLHNLITFPQSCTNSRLEHFSFLFISRLLLLELLLVREEQWEQLLLELCKQCGTIKLSARVIMSLQSSHCTPQLVDINPSVGSATLESDPWVGSSHL